MSAKTTARPARKTDGAREIYITNRQTDKKRTQQRRTDRANAYILKGR